MLSYLFRTSKQYIHKFNRNKENYINALNQYSYLVDTFNILKFKVNQISVVNKSNNSFGHLYLKELENIKNELNTIKNDIEMYNKNYTLIYLDIEKCKKKCNTLKLNLLNKVNK